MRGGGREEVKGQNHCTLLHAGHLVRLFATFQTYAAVLQAKQVPNWTVESSEQGYSTNRQALPNTLLQASKMLFIVTPSPSTSLLPFPPLPLSPPPQTRRVHSPPSKKGVCSHLSALFSRQTILCSLSSSSYCTTFDLATSTKWESCLI